MGNFVGDFYFTAGKMTSKVLLLVLIIGALAVVHGSDCSNKIPKGTCVYYKKYGLCTHNKPWMEQNCEAECGFCGQGQASANDNCKDKFTQCTTYAHYNWCSISSVWMGQNCPKSCNKC